MSLVNSVTNGWNNTDQFDLIVGTILGSILLPFIGYITKKFINWLNNQLPINKLLGSIKDQDRECKVFVRDLIPNYEISSDVLISIEPRKRYGFVPNIDKVWPDVEGVAISYIFNVLGQAGKVNNIEITRMSQDGGEWNSNIIVLGAQAQKSFDFYKRMENVAFSMDNKEIYDSEGKVIKREADKYGYGIILKTTNPYGPKGTKAFLIGGFGVLGTLSAAYYFKEHAKDLGKEFGKNDFGILVRTSITAGEQAVERVSKYDKKY